MNQIYERRHKLAVQALGRWNAQVVAAKTETETETEQQPEQQQQPEEAAAKGASSDEDEDEEGVPAWEAGRDPLPPTLDVSFQCADVVEEGAEGYEVLLLVSVRQDY